VITASGKGVLGQFGFPPCGRAARRA
jgi:hypothetical protein